MRLRQGPETLSRVHRGSSNGLVEPGRSPEVKRNYECMVLLDNREVRNGWEALKGTVSSLFEKHGAEIKSARRWDERPLAYPIKGHTRATYLHMAAVADTDQVAAVRRDLQFADPVIRSLITAVEEFPAELHEPEEAFDESVVPLGDEPPAQEEKESKDEDTKEDGKADAKKDDAKKDDAKAEAKADDGDDAAKKDDAKGDDAASGDAEAKTEETTEAKKEES